MSKGKKIASVAFTGVAAMTAVGLRAGTALAASTWHINQPNGTAFTGVNSTSATLTAGGVTLTCHPGTATAAGSVSGNDRAGVPAQLGKVKDASFGTTSSPCSLLGLGVKAHLKHPIGINASQPTTAAGVTKGWIGVGSKTSNPISASISGFSGFSCHMVVAGNTIPASFSNATHTLHVNPGSATTLKIKSVSGCDNLFKANESAGFKATYVTSPPLTVSGG